MTDEKCKGAEITYLRHQLKMASRRLGMINAALTNHGHDAALSAEAEGLTTQIASLEVELREAQT